MKLGTKLVQKLKENRGFTIAELLVTTIILMLAMMLVTQSMDAGIRQFFKRTQHSESDILLGAITNYLQDELTYAADVEISADGKSIVSYTSPKAGKEAVLGIWGDAAEGASPFSAITSAESSRGMLVIDAKYYKELRKELLDAGATADTYNYTYYYPVSESSYMISAGNYGVLEAAISIDIPGVTTDTAEKKHPTGYEVTVKIFAKGSDAVLAQNTFLVGGSVVTASAVSDVVINTSYYTVKLRLTDAGTSPVVSPSWGTNYEKQVDSEIGSVRLPSLTLSPEKTRDYKFNGWSYEDTDGMGHLVEAGETIAVTSDLEINANVVEKGRQNLVLEYGLSHNLKETIDVRYEESPQAEDVASVMEAAKVEGFVFDGWYGFETEVDGASVGTEDNPYATDLSNFVMPDGTAAPITLWAKYTAIEYTLALNGYYGDYGDHTYGGTSADTLNITGLHFNDPIPSNLISDENRDIADTHLRLTGWVWQGTTYAPTLSDFPTTMPAQNVTLTAVWATQHKITLKDGTDETEYYVTSTGKVDGETADSIKDFAGYGTNTSAYTAPSRSGYDFKGWYNNNNSSTAVAYIGADTSGTVTSSGSSKLFAIENDVVLYAGYTRQAYYEKVSGFTNGGTYLIVGGAGGARNVLTNNLGKLGVSVSNDTIAYSSDLASAEWTAENSDYTSTSGWFYLKGGEGYLSFTRKGNYPYVYSLSTRNDTNFDWYYTRSYLYGYDNVDLYSGAYLGYDSPSFIINGSSDSKGNITIFGKVSAGTTVTFF